LEDQHERELGATPTSLIVSAFEPPARRRTPAAFTVRRLAKPARNDAFVLEDQIDVSQQRHDAYDKPARPAATVDRTTPTPNLSTRKNQTKPS
jgi:hypothetical protein